MASQGDETQFSLQVTLLNNIGEFLFRSGMGTFLFPVRLPNLFWYSEQVQQKTFREYYKYVSKSTKLELFTQDSFPSFKVNPSVSSSVLISNDIENTHPRISSSFSKVVERDFKGFSRKLKNIGKSECYIDIDTKKVGVFIADKKNPQKRLGGYFKLGEDIPLDYRVGYLLQEPKLLLNYREFVTTWGPVLLSLKNVLGNAGINLSIYNNISFGGLSRYITEQKNFEKFLQQELGLVKKIELDSIYNKFQF